MFFSTVNTEGPDKGVGELIELADLYEEPFTSFGLNAADKLFTQIELEELVSLVKKLAA